MSEDDLVAPSVATEETAAPVIEQEGQTEGQPAEVKAEEAEKTATQLRRERREQAEQRLAAEARQAKERVAELERQAERANRASAAMPEPKEADYADALEYVADRSAWKREQVSAQVQQSMIKEDQAAAKAQVQSAEEQHLRELQKAYLDDIPEATKRYADFQSAYIVATQGGVVSQELSQMVLQSDVPHDLTYHLGKNPELARALSNMAPIQAARELGRIEASLIRAQPKLQSAAPTPITPVQARGQANKSADDMSYAEYVAARKKGAL